MRNDVIILDSLEALVSEMTNGVILASNGLFRFHRMMIGTKPFLEISSKLGPGYPGDGMLTYADEGLRLFSSKVPRQKLQEVESFFRKVHILHRAEAIVLLYYAPAKSEWMFTAPRQVVSGAHLSYENPGPPPQGWYKVGSIHSHHTMSAFHSGTDDADEMDWDGIHVTIGKITSPQAEYAASVVIDGVRYKVQIEDLVEVAEEVAFPEAWMAMVEKYVPPKPKIEKQFVYPPDDQLGAETLRRLRGG